MSKYDIGALLAALFSAVAAFAVVAKDYLGRWLGKIGKSFVALVASPAVWIAVATCSFGSFWVGHIEGSAGKRALRAQVVTLESRAKASSDVAESAVAKAAALGADVKTKAKENEALKAEIARLTKAPAGAAIAPVAGVSRRVVIRGVPKKPATGVPDKASWAPWNN